jgi:glycosyltransferase involved in cell wall biosynthesis
MTRAAVPLVSAVIPAYNAERYIAEAVDSVLGQTYPALECIAVDDGSTDGTTAVVRRFGSGVRLIEQPNAGPGAARNRGAAAASGEFLAFLDADDAWSPRRVERQMTALEQESDYGAVVCGTQVVDSHGRPLGVLEQSPDVTVRDMLTWRATLVSTGSNLLVERACFEAVGGFDEHIYGSEDWLMTFQLVAAGTLSAISDPLVHYRVHQANLSSSADRLETEMLRAYGEVFSDDRMPEDVRRLRRKAYANLHRMLAGAYFAERNLGAFIREALVSVRTHPSTLPYFLSTPIRRLRGHGPKDPFAMARAEAVGDG